MVRPDSQVFVPSQGLQIFEQQLVLEYTAGKNDGFGSMFSANVPDRVKQSLRNTALEGTSDLRGISSAHAIVENRTQQGAEIELIGLEREGIRVVIRSGTRQLFKPNRGLAFKADGTGEPEKGCCRIEQAADGRGFESTHTLTNQFQRASVAAGEGKRRGFEVRKIVDLR